MKLAIADPPYLGRAQVYAGVGRSWPDRLGAYGRRGVMTAPHGDGNADAGAWNDPNTHRTLVARLNAEYDGWAVSMYPDNLRHYLAWEPEARVCAWTQPDAMPVGAVIRSWEPVLLKRPDRPRGAVVRDALVSPKRGGRGSRLPGTKPPAWTRWVLDMLGYDPETDTVDDLFGGSGAVTAEINQGVLL